jgi:hypothetical protein
MSRIHVAIGYDPLDDEAREQIWDSFFKKLSGNHKNGGPRIAYEYDAKEYVRKSEDVKKLQWNGREIRNGTQDSSSTLTIQANSVQHSKRRLL